MTLKRHSDTAAFLKMREVTCTLEAQTACDLFGATPYCGHALQQLTCSGGMASCRTLLPSSGAAAKIGKPPGKAVASVPGGARRCTAALAAAARSTCNRSGCVNHIISFEHIHR